MAADIMATSTTKQTHSIRLARLVRSARASLKMRLASLCAADNSIIGYVRSLDVSLFPGNNFVHLRGPMIPENMASANAAMSDYFMGVKVDLIAQIDDISYDNSQMQFPASDSLLFEGGVKGTQVPAVLIRDHVNFAAYAYSYGTLRDIITNLILRKDVVSHAEIGLTNPISATVSPKHINVEVNTQSSDHGLYNFAYVNNDMDLSLPGNSITRTGKLEMDFYNPKDGEMNVLEELAAKGLKDGYVCLGCAGTFSLAVADLTLTLTYSQEPNFPACATTVSTDMCDKVVAGAANPCI